jgi:hypothetical protein
MRANQLRLWFASMAYVLLCALRRIALHHTPEDEIVAGNRGLWFCGGAAGARPSDKLSATRSD